MSNENKHIHYLNRCLDLATMAAEKGDHPFGAILVREDVILLESQNQVSSLGPTAHAELGLIQKAFRELPSSLIKECTLYTSTEPCPMCAGAIYWSEIGEVVFATSNKELCKIVGGDLELSCEEIFSRGVRDIKLASYRLDRASELHVEFW